MSFKIPIIKKTFRFNRESARQMNSVAGILNRGVIVDSETIKGQRQQDGRVRVLGGVSPIGAAAAATGPPAPGPVISNFTEFYCRNGGSNLNAGSIASGAEPPTTAAYTSTNGNWNGTSIFTPTDGSTPASFVNVGDFASVYLDGASFGVYIARVTAVASGVNGAITLSTTAKAGTVPTSGVSGRSIKVGGAWLGPVGGSPNSSFPSGQLTGLANATNASGNRVRVNFKNDQTYSVVASSSLGAASCTFQGYGSSAGDGGKTILSSNITTGPNFTLVATGQIVNDLIFVSTGSSGTNPCVTLGGGASLNRCVAHGARGAGFLSNSGRNQFIECEAYDNNKSNTANIGGFTVNGIGAIFYYCISHHNSGSNSSGWFIGFANIIVSLNNCISHTNGKYGIGLGSASTDGTVLIANCDFYNNTSDGINYGGTDNVALIIRNCNFLKNGGAGINAATARTSGVADNNGYGSGTQANGSADTLQGIIDSGSSVTYPPGATPWVNLASGDFRIDNSLANHGGRGAFTQTSGGSGTVGYPGIGAAQHLG